MLFQEAAELVVAEAEVFGGAALVVVGGVEGLRNEAVFKSGYTVGEAGVWGEVGPWGSWSRIHDGVIFRECGIYDDIVGGGIGPVGGGGGGEADVGNGGEGVFAVLFAFKGGEADAAADDGLELADIAGPGMLDEGL